jgi:hypothetical protein
VLTFDCVFEMLTGPCGTLAALRHRPVDDSLSVGPPTVTRRSATIHITDMHGLGCPLGNVNEQPETVKVSDCVTRYASALTREFEVVADTDPPCGHISVDAVVNE